MTPEHDKICCREMTVTEEGYRFRCHMIRDHYGTYHGYVYGWDTGNPPSQVSF